MASSAESTICEITRQTGMNVRYVGNLVCACRNESKNFRRCIKQYVTPFCKIIELLRSITSDDLNTITITANTCVNVDLSYMDDRIHAVADLETRSDDTPRNSVKIEVDDGQLMNLNIYRMTNKAVKSILWKVLNDLSTNTDRLKIYNHFYHEINRIKAINNFAPSDYRLSVHYRTYTLELWKVDDQVIRYVRQRKSILSGEISQGTFDRFCAKYCELTGLDITRSGNRTKPAIRKSDESTTAAAREEQ